MKKRFIALILFMFVFVMAGCDLIGGEQTDNTRPSNPDSGDLNDDQQQDVVYSTVLEQAIHAIFVEQSNMTIMMEMFGTDMDGYAFNIRIDGSTVHYEALVDGVIEHEDYRVEEDGVIYLYSYIGNDQWSRYEIPVDYIDLIFLDIFDDDLSASWFTEGDPGHFTLQEAYFSQVFGEDAEEINRFTIEIDASMNSIWTVEGEDEGEPARLVITINNLGSTVIDLPDLTIDDEFTPPVSYGEPWAMGTLAPGGENEHVLTITDEGFYYVFISSNFDSYGEIETLDGQFLSDDDDSMGYLDFKISVYLRPGQYVVLVTGFYDDDYGDYFLYLEREEDYPTPYTHGSLRSGEENSHNIIIEHTGWYDIYAYTTFDSIGELRTLDGGLLERNDDNYIDGNWTNDFKMLIFLEAGTYELIILGYDASEYGAYTIFVVPQD